MDEFGVLVESIGFKGQRNSAPLADLKNKRHVTQPTKSEYSDNQTQKNYGGFGGFDNTFGDFKSNANSGLDGFDLDLMFKGNNLGVNRSMYADDDIFGGLPAQQRASADDLLGLGSNGSRWKSEETKTSSGGFDDLMSGFSGKSPMGNTNRKNTGKIQPPPSAGKSVKSTASSAADPFIVLEQSSPPAHSSGKNSSFSSVDDLDVFAMGGKHKDTNAKSDIFHSGKAADDLDSIFNIGSKGANASTTKSTSSDPVYDSLFQNQTTRERGPTVEKAPASSTNMKKGSSQANSMDDLLFFGENANPSSGVFQEVEGESEERRTARWKQHMRTQERMAKALAEKNQRDLQTQQEQDERHRVAEAVNNNIKRWAAGKEGNLRSLLSSLQHVLWPECGWQPVSLTDMITSGSVKKIYHKATLCVHPDKVQQKGANVQQKYIAEKVFDLLKEAWNKFNAEELR